MKNTVPGNVCNHVCGPTDISKKMNQVTPYSRVLLEKLIVT